MKKILTIVGIMVMVMVMSAVTVMALPFNVRPVTTPPAFLFDNGLGEQEWGGATGLFASMGATTYAADPVGTQSNAAIFTSEASGGAIASFVIALAGTSGSNISGIYQYGNTGNKIPIFLGGVSSSAQAFITFYENGDLRIVGADANVNSGLYSGFGNVFGFYLTGPGGTFYTEDDKNIGNPQAIIWRGNGSDTLNIPGILRGGTFGRDEWLIAWENQPYLSSDRDFQDNAFIVESITTIPEPATLLLLGFGLLGLAGIRRKFKSSKS